MKLTGGLWKRQTRDGRTFFSGPGPFGTQIFINPVENKATEKSPDFTIAIEMPREKSDAKDLGADFDRSPGF